MSQFVVSGARVQRRHGGAQLPAAQRGQYALTRRSIGQQQGHAISLAQSVRMQSACHGVHTCHKLGIAEPVAVAPMRWGGQRESEAVTLRLLAQPVRDGDVVKGMERVGGHGAVSLARCYP